MRTNGELPCEDIAEATTGTSDDTLYRWVAVESAVGNAVESADEIAICIGASVVEQKMFHLWLSMAGT